MSYNVVVGIYEKIGTNNCCGRRTDSHLICGGFHTRDEAMQYIDNNEINGYKYTYSDNEYPYIEIEELDENSNVVNVATVIYQSMSMMQ